MKLKPRIKLNHNSKQMIISFRILEDVKKTYYLAEMLYFISHFRH